jgi:hypothetical protein
VIRRSAFRAPVSSGAVKVGIVGAGIADLGEGGNQAGPVAAARPRSDSADSEIHELWGAH